MEIIWKLKEDICMRLRLLGKSAQCGNYEKLLTHFLLKFRENNVFTEEITQELIWRNFFSIRENFSFFLTVSCQFHLHITLERISKKCWNYLEVIQIYVNCEFRVNNTVWKYHNFLQLCKKWSLFFSFWKMIPISNFS